MYYVGNYEKEVIQGGSTKEFDYICTPEGLSAIAVKTGGTRSLYYVQTDHLGSIRVVTNASKAVQTRYYYDAWGKQTLLAGTGITNRGYTGEEHLSDFGLINLNARLYDPILGRFLEVDPYVSMPDFTQAFNRYTYGLNNPLKYTDPDGEFWQFFVMAAWSYFKGVNDNKGQWNPSKWENTVVLNVGYNTGGNWSASGGFGNSFGPMPIFGYDSQQGLGIGLTYNGNTSMYYPNYDNRITNAIVSWGNTAIEDIRSLTLNDFLYATPVLGASMRGGDAWDAGDYWGYAGYFGEGLFEMFTLGAGSEIIQGVKTAGNFVKTGVNSLRGIKVAKMGSQTLYRAVSKAELDDIAIFGLRNRAGAYETGKLFAPTAKEAVRFGKNNFIFDGLPNTIIKVRVPNSVMQNAYRFGADGMNAVSIPAEYLHLLRTTPLKYSPLP